MEKQIKENKRRENAIAILKLWEDGLKKKSCEEEVASITAEKKLKRNETSQ